MEAFPVRSAASGKSPFGNLKKLSSIQREFYHPTFSLGVKWTSAPE